MSDGVISKLLDMPNITHTIIARKLRKDESMGITLANNIEELHPASDFLKLWTRQDSSP